jgi:GDPmannose 4,6-dehydratase
MTRKKALITGITGQDGSLLANNLLNEGFKVSGTFRRGSANNLWRLEELGILDRIELFEHTFGIDSTELAKILRKKYEYIFHLAGDSFTQDSFRHPHRTLNTNLIGGLELMENLLEFSKDSKTFIACSSEIFGFQSEPNMFVNEDSNRNPLNPYGVAHSAILDLSRIFRNTYSQFISVGILFNHESEYRGVQFLTRKLSKGLSSIKNGSNLVIEIGNFDSSRDWGSAREFVEAFKMILDDSEPNDFIIATGKSVSVRQVIVMCCDALGFEPEFSGKGVNETCIDRKSGRTLIKSSPKFFRAVDTPCLIGDVSKIQDRIGWAAQVSFNSVIKKMCEFDLAGLTKSG